MPDAPTDIAIGLENHAATLEAVVAGVRHGIVLWDEHNRIVVANSAAREIIGAPPGAVVPGRSLDDLVAILLQNGILGEGDLGRALARHVLEQDRTQTRNEWRIMTDGRILEIGSTPTPQGGFTTTLIDVTTTHAAEEALLAAKAAAEAANVSKSRFLAAMGSELRSPLKAILAEMGALSRDAAGVHARQLAEPAPDVLDAAEVQHSCDAVIDSGRHLLGLIDTILDVARLEAGRFELADDVLDLPQLIRLCLRESDRAAAAGEVILASALPASLPHIRADERRMRQALAHLVANAVKFTGALGHVRVGASVEPGSGDVLLTVVDTGIGIAEGDLERVFEPFTKLATQRRGRGTAPAGGGLGLYICRTLSRAHGGDVALQSVPGRGTTATLRIPATRVVPGPVERAP